MIIGAMAARDAAPIAPPSGAMNFYTYIAEYRPSQHSEGPIQAFRHPPPASFACARRDGIFEIFNKMNDTRSRKGST